MKTILVPTDLSPMTDMALSVAVSLARTDEAEIILLHSVNFPMVTTFYDEELTVRATEAYAEYERDTINKLNAFASDPAYAGVTITPKLIKEGKGLVQDINDQSPDLIILSSKGASGLEELLIGSNAEVVVRHAHCPVLVVKRPIESFEPKTIICAIDVDDHLKSIQLYPFQNGDQALHKFLYIMTPSDNRDPDGVRDWVTEFAASKGINNYEVVIRPGQSVQKGIVHYADEIRADLVVLFTHGHTGFQHLIMGSVAEDVLNHAHFSVLVMRA